MIQPASGTETDTRTETTETAIVRKERMTDSEEVALLLAKVMIGMGEENGGEEWISEAEIERMMKLLECLPGKGEAQGLTQSGSVRGGAVAGQGGAVIRQSGAENFQASAGSKAQGYRKLE